MKIQKKLMEVRCSLKSEKEEFNSYGKYSYRNAEKMLSTINPLLKKQGLTLDFSDDIVVIGDRFYLKSTLTIHDTEDGETYSTTAMAREPLMKRGSDEAQITGACMTYAHKYALMGMFAISDNKMDPDSMENVGQSQQIPVNQTTPLQYPESTTPLLPPQFQGQAQYSQPSNYGCNAQ